MRKFSIILLILLNSSFFAQMTGLQLINYQGVARDASSNPIVGPIGVRFHIHQTTANGPIVFTEVHNPTTNIHGIFNVKIGSNNSSQFAAITWGTDDYFLEVQIDPTGNTAYTSIGSQQLVSVPYALYAKTAGNSASYNAGSNITFTGPANNQTINSNPNLSLAGNVLSISGSGSPVTIPTTSLTASPNVTLTNTGSESYDIKVKNYVAGSNITILSPTAGTDYTINASGTATSAPYNLSVNGPHSVTTGPSASLTIVAPNINVTGGGATVTNNIMPNYAIHIPTVVVTPTTGGLSFSQNGNTSTVAVGGSAQWTNTGPVVHLVTGSNNVGIGTTNSTAKLTVTTNIAVDAILAQSSGANGILAQSISSGTADAGVYGTNNGSGFGVKGESISTNAAVSGVKGSNTGPGAGVIGENLNSNTSSNSHGVKGETNGTNVLAAGVFGNNQNAGSGVYGINSSVVPSSSAHGVKGVTNNAGAAATGVTGINTSSVGTGVYGEHSNTALSANAHGVYGKTNSTGVTSYGVYGENVGTGSGVYGSTSSSAINAAGVFGKNFGTTGSGIIGESSATGGAAAGVYGENFGATPGVVGESSSSSNSPLAMGVRGLTNSTNSVAIAVSGESTGAAIGVRASIPSTVIAGSSHVALLVENGHFRSTTFVAPVISTFASSGGLTTGTYTPNNCTDAKGSVLAVCTTTGLINSGGFITIRVSFHKSYMNNNPTVVITPTSDFGLMSYFVSSVGPAFFNLTIKNNTAGIISGTTQTFNFNYFVIE